MVVEDERCGKGDGTDLPESAFADDLEQPEVKEGDLAVKINRLRATANSPHGVVKGRIDSRRRLWTGRDHVQTLKRASHPGHFPLPPLLSLTLSRFFSKAPDTLSNF
jgi:hypothetical protein